MFKLSNFDSSIRTLCDDAAAAGPEAPAVPAPPGLCDMVSPFCLFVRYELLIKSWQREPRRRLVAPLGDCKFEVKLSAGAWSERVAVPDTENHLQNSLA